MVLYTRNVGIVVTNQEGRIWCGKRVEDGWSMPQGDVEDGEEVLDTAQRELYEETGLLLGVSQVLGGQFSYMIPGGGAKLQTWVHTRWCGDRTNLRPKLGIRREFKRFEWITSDEVIDRCVWFKKDVYRAVLQRVLR